jgi:catechol 2,3-dioxygenase-like lactoylglutathione lyase family enzyme
VGEVLAGVVVSDPDIEGVRALLAAALGVEPENLGSLVLLSRGPKRCVAPVEVQRPLPLEPAGSTTDPSEQRDPEGSGALRVLHHVQLPMPAGEHEAARRFFGRALGLREVPKPAALAANGGLWFSGTNLMLHLGEDGAYAPPSSKAHVAILVAGLARRRSILQEAGFEPEVDETLPGLERCYVADPFGSRIELIEERTASLLDAARDPSPGEA